MKTKTTRPRPIKKLAAFRLPRPTLARLRAMARRSNLSQARTLEALIHSATL